MRKEMKHKQSVLAKKSAQASTKKKGQLEPTRVIVKYDVGFSNCLSIRGKGAGLSWDKGVPLRNVGPDEWIWETSASTEECEFKVLINDQIYETGENHRIYRGGIVQYTPQFPLVG